MASIGSSVGEDGKNRKRDVALVQELLNAHAVRLDLKKPLGVDGDCGKRTLEAIAKFQLVVVGAAKADGRIDPKGRTWRELVKVLGVIPKGVFARPEWIKVACGEEGTSEKPGLDKNEARILEYLATVPGLANVKYKKTDHMMSDIDETAWCACFVKWCLIQAGKSKGPGAQARS